MSAPEELTRELERLLARFGKAVVGKEAKRLTKGTGGRKYKDDAGLLWELVKSDVQAVIDGIDIFEKRTKYSIAKEFAEKNPGHSNAATHQRIENKLNNRKNAVILAAIIEVIESYPHVKFVDISDKYGHLKFFKNLFDLHLGVIEEYRKLIGAPPEEMSMAHIGREVNRLRALPPVNVLQALCHPIKP